MRIKPYVVLGLATVGAVVAVATIVMTNDPYTIDARMAWLFWSALFLAVWGLTAAAFSRAGQRLALALSSGLFWAAGMVSLAMLAHQGVADTRLSAGIIGATIVLSLILWIRSKRSAQQL